MKKSVYLVTFTQEFNAIKPKRSNKWYKPVEFVSFRDSVEPEHKMKYILASSPEEAIDEYKKRYKWNDYDEVLDHWYGALDYYPKPDNDNPDFTYELSAICINISFDTMKKKLRADEFLEYCRQELMPLEVILK